MMKFYTLWSMMYFFLTLRTCNTTQTWSNFMKTGRWSSDYYYAIFQFEELLDGSFIGVGYTNDFFDDDSKFHGVITKLHRNGSLDFVRRITYTRSSTFFSISVSSGEDFCLIAGTVKYSGDEYYHYKDLVLKMAMNTSEIIWSKIYIQQVDRTGQLSSIRMTPDSGAFVMGVHGTKRAWVARLNSYGNITWARTLGDDTNSAGSGSIDSLILQEDGFLFCWYEYVSGTMTWFLTKISLNGSLLFVKRSVGDEHLAVSSLIKTDDGYIIGGGHDASNSMNIFVAKVKSDFSVVWSREIDCIWKQYIHNVVYVEKTGDILFLGGNNNVSCCTALNFGKFTSDGYLFDFKIAPRTGYDTPRTMLLTKNNQSVIISSEKNRTFWFAKLGLGMDGCDYLEPFDIPYEEKSFGFSLEDNYDREIEEGLLYVEFYHDPLDNSDITFNYYLENTCFSCFGYTPGNESFVCSGFGNCTSLDFCDCADGYDGEICDIFHCNGKLQPLGCNYPHGTCLSKNSCGCEIHYDYNPKHCNVTTCSLIFSNDSNNVCSGHGSCVEYNHCECDTKYFGSDCEIPSCYSILANDSNVCSNQNGRCDEYNHCNCSSGYSGDDCAIFSCGGIFIHNETTEIVCSGHGICTSLDNCQCHNTSIYFYSGFNNNCSIWKCFNHFNTDKENVCSGHGECIDHDNCSCIASDYTGEKCEEFLCWGIPSTNVDNVCASHGSCYDVNLCLCLSGYQSSDVSKAFGPCDLWTCGRYEMSDEVNVCSGRGDCLEYNDCDCKGGYHGEECEDWSCGVEKDDPLTCSGNGKCLSPNECDCDTGHGGELCQTNLLLLTVMTPILSVVGVIGICLLIGLCGFGLLLILCMVVLFNVFLLSVVGIIFVQKIKFRKFGKLKNIDILLKEQEMEDDDSVAHLRINSHLFELKYKDIKVIKILGEGGSSSIVYKAMWLGKTVAFKCFKTRRICESQDTFNEFEREVEVMISLSHPNIIRFFGAVLNPPRVGIVMEFCEKGEMAQFLEEYRRVNGRGYSIHGKTRMLLEVVQSLEYLHSKSIIHRDLKSENVLINEQETCKLMDFGLSKIVERISVEKTKRIGTSIYMAPEIITDSNYDEKCDVFSFSILAFIVITENNHPYGGSEEYGIELKVSNDENFRPDISLVKEVLVKNKKMLWLVDVIQTCWKGDPDERYSFKDLSERFLDHQKGKGENGMKSVEEEEEVDFEEEKRVDIVSDIPMKKLVLEYEKRVENLEERIKALEDENKNLKMENLEEYD